MRRLGCCYPYGTVAARNSSWRTHPLSEKSSNQWPYPTPSRLVYSRFHPLLKIFALSPRKFWRFLKRSWFDARRVPAAAKNPNAQEPTKFPRLEGARREIYIFRSADAFHEAGLLAAERVRTTDNEGQKFNLGLVYGVNGALAVELYLKCLLAIECNQVPETHDLQKLYLQLSRESRAKLRKRHDKLAKDNPVLSDFRKSYGIKTDLESLLEDGKDVFTQFRYLFEGVRGRTKGLGFLLELFGQVVRNRILDLRPGWLSDESTSPTY